jgi:hypothetical protein
MENCAHLTVPSCLVLSYYCSKNFDDWGPEARGEG